jgi:hypothetical protein
MKYRFVAFHTMARGSGKPTYVVNCAKALADAGARVLVLDGLMYEQGAIPHQFYVALGATPIAEDGKNLYDLIRDYEILYLARGTPAPRQNDVRQARLSNPATRLYRGRLYPDAVGRASSLPGHPAIGYLPGNNGRVVEIRERIDFQELYDRFEGRLFFDYVKDTLAECFDVVLANAPAGHQEISGILCGQLADLVLAIDIDGPAVEPNASFQACKLLADRASAENRRRIEVRSVKGHSVSQVVGMIEQA